LEAFSRPTSNLDNLGQNAKVEV